MYYIYDKKTGALSRMIAKPFMQKNSQFVEITEEDFNARLKALREGADAEKNLFEGGEDDLSEGVSDEADGEDGQ